MVKAVCRYLKRVNTNKRGRAEVRKMVSLKDIAEICNVSVSTVSKALNDKHDISADVKKEIQRVAKELNYIPNFMASTLKSKRTKNIGVVLMEKTGTNLMHEFFAKILNSFKDTVEERGYFLTFINGTFSPNRMSILEQCKYMSFDGVFLLCGDMDNPEICELMASNFPIVAIDHTDSNISSVLSNNYGDMKRLVEHMYIRGHRRIAYIHGNNSRVTRDRVNAYRDFMKEHQLQVPKEYLYVCSYRDYERSSALTKAVLALPKRPTAILYPDDLTALGGLKTIDEAGLRVPHDISIAGYDGINMVNIIRPRITTIRQDTVSMGIQAGNKLINRIEFPQSTYGADTSVVDGILEPGESVSVISTRY